MIVVKASKHPLRDEWVEAHVDGGQTIRQIVGDVPVHAWIDGHEVPAYLLEHARIKDNVTVVVRPVPQGGDVLRSVAQVAVIAFAAAVSGGAIFGLTGFAAHAAGMGIALGGGLLINTLIPPSIPTIDRGKVDSFNRLQSLTGASNRVAAFQPIPRLYGRMRFFPPIPMTAHPYTELQGGDQYLRMMVVLGHGPLQIGGKTVGPGQSIIDENTPLTGTPIQIDNTDIHDFSDVEFEIGRPSQMTLYTDQVIETNPGFVTETDISGISPSASAQWVNDGDSAIRTTDTGATEISIGVIGQLFTVSSGGNTELARIDWKIEYRLVGNSTWIVEANPWTISSSKKETVRRGYRWKVSAGQYEVRLTRVRTFFQNFEAVGQQMTWNALRTFRGGKRAFDVDGTIIMTLRIRASDQLNGRVDSLSVEATSILKVWNSTAWVEQPTRVPAWIYADILTGSANRRPLTLDDLDADELLNWANQTNADNDFYDMVYDSSATVLERLREVTSIGRATWSINADTSISVIRDTEQTDPRMVISPRNSHDFSYEMSSLELPHALRVRFIDSTTWENTERLVFDDTYDESNATLYEVLEGPGITDPDQAWRYGRYHLAQQRLRPERYFYSQNVQHLRYKRGDLVTLHHDVILTGIAAGRIKSITTNGSGDTIAFVSDEFLTMPSVGLNFGVKIQRGSDGSVVVVGVQNDAPGNTSITLDSPVSDVNPDDHFVFGVVGAESIDVKVSAIEPQGNFMARVTCVPAAPNILDALTGVIPAFDPVLTAPIDPDKLPLPVPTIDRVVSDETVLVPDGDGSMRIRMVVESSVRGFPGWDQSRQVRFRDEVSGTWITLPPSPQDSQSIFDVSEGVEYAVQVRSVGGTRASAWVPEVPILHTVIGKTSPPSDVTEFSVSAARDRIQLTWSAVPDADVSHYEIREGTVWATATFIANTDGRQYQTGGVSNGPWLIKAFDTSGNESVNAASASLAGVDLPVVTNVTAEVVDNNVLLRWESAQGTFDLATHEIRRGNDVNTASVIGVSDKTFDVIFETVSGEFTYHIVPIDAAGNEGESESVTAAVDEPPAFILRNRFQTDWMGFQSTNVQPIQQVPLPARVSTRDFTSLEFDGVDDFVDIDNTLPANSTNTATGTIELLFQADDTQTRGVIYEEGGATNGINVYVDSDLVYVGWWSDSTAGTQQFLSTPIKRGKWYHIAATYDSVADSFTGYLNAVQFNSGAIGGVNLAAHTDSNTIGALFNDTRFHDGNDTSGPSRYFKGRIREIRRWASARTQTEISNWKDRTLHGDEANLDAYWRGQEGSGNTLADKSNNGQDGAISGASWHLPQVRALIPFPTSSTPNSRNLEGFPSPQALIDAGHQYPALPAPTSATFEEIYDAGTVIPSTRINVTLASSPVVGSVTESVTISIKQNLVDAWTDFTAGQSQVFATNFRYVKVLVNFTTGGASFINAQDIDIVLSTKQKTDSGNINVTTNPTTVSFNTSFIDIDSLTVSPQGDTALIPVVDFVDAPNPTGFDVYLFDNSGNPATGVVRWAASGV